MGEKILHWVKLVSEDKIGQGFNKNIKYFKIILNLLKSLWKLEMWLKNMTKWFFD